MPSILNIKQEEIDSAEKRAHFFVSVVGCGRKGVLYAYAFASAGYKVACLDSDLSVVKSLAKGKTPFKEQEIEDKIKVLMVEKQLSVSSELEKNISASDIVVVAVPAKIDDKKKVDLTAALAALKQVGESLQCGALVIYGVVAGLGFVEGPVKETLENTSGLKVDKDFSLAYVPIHNSQTKLAGAVSELELNVAVTGKTSCGAALRVVSSISRNVKQITDVKTAEVAALFAASKQDTNAALASELAVFCENASIDYFEVSEALRLSDQSFRPTTVDEENKNEAYLLLESAENYAAKLKLPTLARQINEEMVRHAVNLTSDALRGCDKTLRRARIAVLGVISPNTSAVVFIKLLQAKGAKISLFDPVSKSDVEDLGVAKNSLNETVEGVDGVVILTAEEQFKRLNLRKLKALTKTPSVIVDLAGALDPSKVEAEGFIYRGLGRGTEQK